MSQSTGKITADANQTGVANSEQPGAIVRSLHLVKVPVIIASIGAVGLILYSTWRYGSPKGAVLAAQGYAVQICPSTVYLESVVAARETPVRFRVKNLRPNPVTIVGSRATCRCSRLHGLPATIAAGASLDIDASISPSPADVGKPLAGSVLLYLDVASPPVVVGIAVKTVVPSNPAN